LLAFVSTYPFSGIDGSGTVRIVLKFFRLSNDLWMLICLTVSNWLAQPITIRFPPTFFRENFGSVSACCCAMTSVNRKLYMMKRRKLEYRMRFVISGVRQDMDSFAIKQQIYHTLPRILKD